MSKMNFEEYISSQINNFNESSLLSPNKNGDKENGEIKQIISEIIKSDNLNNLLSKNNISADELILASTIITLGKFNFTDESLIFFENDVPFAGIFKDRTILIREYLSCIHDEYMEAQTFINEGKNNNLVKEYGINPEFYYSFGSDLQFSNSPSNYLNISENDEKIVLTLHYNDELYSPEYIEIFMDSYSKIIDQFINNDLNELKLCDIELETQSEIPEFAPVENPILHKRFEMIVEEKPDDIALTATDATLTYAELNEKSNRIANALISKDVKPKSNVLVMLPRTSDLIASIWGVLKAGCTFIPIDLEYPQERIDYIYENCQAQYIISNNASSDNMLDINDLLEDENTENPNVDVSPEDLAYMIYTSGSTGNPKGVMICHRNICNLVNDCPKINYDKILSMSTIAFDVAFEDIFTGLTCGAELIFADDVQIKSTPELVKLINKHKPEVMDLTPSRLAAYLEINSFCEAIKCLKCIFLGGEKFSATVYEEFLKYNSSATVYNSYGPTETTITSNNKIVTDVNDLTVGPANPNYITDVRDIDGKLLPQGVMGELYIGGTGVGKGYYNLDDKTKEVFIEINGIPYYKSGDYAIETPNGEINIKGRIDNQIKLRGLRIEIGEIESNIGNYPNIKQNVVVIKELNNNDHLCAYFTAEKEIDFNDLKEYLKERLTRYMVPTVFMQLDEMPQTPNGKTDIKQLPEPELKLSLALPETETEELLFDIASDIVEIPEFGVTDDLYSIGFTSLTLMKFNAIIYEQLGVNLDIIELLNNPTIKEIASQIDNTDETKFDLEKFRELSNETVYYPLTSNQLGVYYECIKSDEEAHYNLPSIIRFDSDIDANKLKEAIIKTIDHYPYLKLRLITKDGNLTIKRDDSIEIDEIPIVEIDSITDEEIEKNDVKSFDLENNQLFRFKIYKTESETVLFSDFHHLITDGESLDDLFRNISYAYQGMELDKEVVDGYINSLIQWEYESSEESEESHNYFKDKISDGIDSTVLTPNLNGNEESGIIKSISKHINSKEIKNFCSLNKISPNVLIMASTILNLNKYTFSDKTLITTIFNGRFNSNYFNTQAFLVKSLPLILSNENRSQSIKELLGYVDGTWKEVINNSYYSYDKLAEEFQITPEFFYTYNNLDNEIIEINGNSYGIKYLETLETNYKITFDVNEFEDDLEFFIGYNDQLYSPDYIETFLNCVLDVLNQIITSDIEKLMIKDIELNKTVKNPIFKPVENPILHRRFEKRVEEKPEEIALVATDQTLTYEQLNQKANKIANSLIKHGVKPKSNVLVMLHRDSKLIASIMGILKAGCTFIPIDLEYPKERIEYIYENSQADYIICDITSNGTLDIKELLKEKDTSNPNISVDPNDTAYMIYTSGSTGKPKGVMISHENICNQVQNPKSGYDSLLCLATIAFDVSIDDILTTLSNGNRLILASDTEIKNIPELIQLIETTKPEVSEITPSRLASYLEVDRFCEAIKCLKCLFLGGEQFSTNVFTEFRNYSDAIVYNSYGPTETTITSNNKEITDVNDITVGLPLENYVTDVRDIDGKLLPQGVMGELYIGGPSVGKGYYNLDEKTKEVFLEINGIPYYRSGDYAIERPNGEIDIKGRIDNQIKLRGLRIELGEIESNIGKFPNIKQNVAVIKTINNAEHLCAYFTADGETDIRLLKRFLESKLTKYMVPSVFIQMDELPQTPNGKTDLKQLPEPELNLEYVKPETETEEIIFKIASELIDTDEFGITDDLYSLGFSSLTLMKLNSRIYAATNVNIDINALFTNPTVQSLADKVDNNISTGLDIDKVIADAENQEYFPVTSNQLGIYYECIQTEELKYTMPYVIRLGSDVDPYKLKDALITTVEAHPYIKTRFVNVDGELKQKRSYDEEINEIEIIEIDSISDEELIEKEVKPFIIENNQLFRFKIYKTLEGTVLFFDFHHMISDGVSQENFFKDVESAYKGEEIKTERIDGYVYSLIEQELAVNEVSEKFFKNKFADDIESTVLTPNLNGNPEIGEIKCVSDSIGSDFVKYFCQDHSISKNVLFMTATIVALNKFTFSDKSLITTIFNGRANPDVFDTQGMLVKTLPLIVNSENREMLVEDYIKVVDKAWKDAIVHSDYSYIKLSEDYQLKPEFFYFFHEDMDKNIIEINGKSYDAVSIEPVVSTSYKINFDIYDDGEDISLYLEYNDQIYTEEYIREFLNAIKYVLIQFFVNDLDKISLKDIELVNSFDIPELGQLDNPILHKRFEKQVEENGNETALVACDDTLTYNQLNEKANRIANALIKKGAKPKDNVLIMLPRDSNLIATIFGILKAGCAFVPLDLEYPQDRIDYIYENSQADFIINTSGESDNSLNIYDLIKEENASNPDVNVSSDDVAYMIYTSGSTGKPKGVMITHANICNQVQNPKSQYESLLCLATIAFDVSLDDILTTLSNGNKLILASDTEIKNIYELVKLLETTKPEVSEITPSRLASYLEVEEFCEAIKCIKCLFLGGEQFSTKVFTDFRKYSDAVVYNSYGPTETTITSNNKEITDINDITVGLPLENYITDVRDNDGKLLPQGAMGELYIGGLSVGKGYYNMPEKTKEVFLEIDGIPYYRSGDYAIELPNGEIDIRGRIDNQIKLRGLRIEIGEIEYNINQFKSIKRVAVVIKKISGNDHLCAYFTADEEIDVDELKLHLKDKLTYYMVPTVFMQMETMPETPNGKIDTKALPEIDVNDLKVEYVAPTTETEKLVVKAFEEVFGQEKIGINDDFLLLGGDSLTSIKITSLLSKEDISVNVNTIIRKKTPHEIARVIDEGVVEYGFTLAKKGTIDKNLFLIPPISGTSFLYLYLIENLEFEGNVYFIDDFKFDLSIEEMKKTDANDTLAKYYEAIKDIFQDGDIIAGYSQGCIYTAILTSMLEKDKKVDKCILIDGYLNFKETDKIDKAGVMELVEWVGTTDFDLVELAPEPFDSFLDKIVEICIINSVCDFEPVTIDSPVIYLGTEDHVDGLSEIAKDHEFVFVDTDHLSIVEKDVKMIIKYFN